MEENFLDALLTVLYTSQDDFKTIREVKSDGDIPLKAELPELSRLNATHPGIEEFYRKVNNGFEIKWDIEKYSSVGGNIQFVEAKYLFADPKSLGFYEEDTDEDADIRFYHPFDYPSPESYVGFVIRPETIKQSVYYLSIGDYELCNLDLDFEGYTQMALEARVFNRWQVVLLYHMGSIRIGSWETEAFKNEMPKVFPGWTWENFIAKFESLRLSKNKGGEVIINRYPKEFSAERPAVLMFYLKEFEQTFGQLAFDVSQTLYDCPFFIYDKSLKNLDLKFEDETDINNEDCATGFAILKNIWVDHVAQSSTPLYATLFKKILDPDKETFAVESTYGFLPGYDLDAAIATAVKQNFLVFRWDEYWENTNDVKPTALLKPEHAPQEVKDFSLLKFKSNIMKNELLNSDEAQKMMAQIAEKMNPLMVEGRTYHAEITRDEHGHSGGSVYFYEDGMLHDYMNSGKYTDDEFSEHTDAFRDTDFDDLIRFFPVHSKVIFTFSKGAPIQAEQYTIAMFLEDIKTSIEKDHRKPEDKILKKELLVHFKPEADELGMFIDSTEYTEKSMRSSNFTRDRGDLKSIYYLLGEQLKSLYFKYESGTIAAQSDPAFEEHGLSPLAVTSIEVDPEYQKRKDAFADGVKMRHAFFNSLGKLDERIIYLRVGGFRDNSWPEDSTSHNSCKMRVIHTAETTILITDGLTDIYPNSQSDQNLEYNGIGAEFYMEFFGQIPYEVLHKHFAMALVNSVSQVALAHGDIKNLMLSKKQISVEFTEENIEIWINRENDANHNLSTFLTPERFIKDDSFGVILGTESKLVPQQVKLNLEEVLMISVKPVDSVWLKKTKLRSEDDEKSKVAREAILKEWKDSGAWNLVPLTYQKEYVQGEPESGGIVLTPLFPF